MSRPVTIVQELTACFNSVGLPCALTEAIAEAPLTLRFARIQSQQTPEPCCTARWLGNALDARRCARGLLFWINQGSPYISIRPRALPARRGDAWRVAGIVGPRPVNG